MKRFIKYILNGVGGTAAMVLFWSCAAESPYESESTGTVQLHTVVNNLTTRAATIGTNNVTGYDQTTLANNCVVSIYRKNGRATGDNATRDGLVYQVTGLDKVEKAITLRTGHYEAEASTGESVPASFDKKYFKAHEGFDISKNSVINVTLNCKIQNSVVIINPHTITGKDAEDPKDWKPLEELMDNYSITVTGSNGNSLTFNKDNITSKGYFMMAEGDTELNYTIEGNRKGTTGAEGHFVKTGKISDVKRSWQYTINIIYNPPVSNDGHVDTSFINIEIADEDAATEETGSIASYNPTIEGFGFTIPGEVTYTSENEIPDKLVIKVCAAGNGFQSATLTIDNGEPQNLSESLPGGLTWEQLDATNNVTVAYLEFGKSYISSLSGSHTFTISVTDRGGKNSTATLTINRETETTQQ